MIKEYYDSNNKITLEYCCDFCAYSTTRNKSNTGITPIMECKACGRLMCSGHRRFHRDPGVRSHRGMYCLECWEIGRKYREKMISVQNQAWEKENDLRLEWHMEGREKKRQKLASLRKLRAEHYSTLG